ncbi:MAG: hypothetical protein H6Q51_2088 [Deltaproteobacteria bacterium]|nr:hypothetical protein [Deltaproteobacteria bacterium]
MASPFLSCVPSPQGEADGGGEHGGDDDMEVPGKQQGQNHGQDAGNGGGDRIETASELEHQEAEEHGDEGVVDPEGPARYELPGHAAQEEVPSLNLVRLTAKLSSVTP